MVICVTQTKKPCITMLNARFLLFLERENSSGVFREVIIPAVERCAGG